METSKGPDSSGEASLCKKHREIVMQFPSEPSLTDDSSISPAEGREGGNKRVN